VQARSGEEQGIPTLGAELGHTGRGNGLGRTPVSVHGPTHGNDKSVSLAPEPELAPDPLEPVLPLLPAMPLPPAALALAPEPEPP
jgi:hypothetical protein